MPHSPSAPSDGINRCVWMSMNGVAASSRSTAVKISFEFIRFRTHLNAASRGLALLNLDRVIRPAELISAAHRNYDPSIVRRISLLELRIQNLRVLVAQIFQMEFRVAVGGLQKSAGSVGGDRSQFAAEHGTLVVVGALCAVQAGRDEVEIRSLQIAAVGVDLHAGSVHFTENTLAKIG